MKDSKLKCKIWKTLNNRLQWDIACVFFIFVLKIFPQSIFILSIYSIFESLNCAGCSVNSIFKPVEGFTSFDEFMILFEIS